MSKSNSMISPLQNHR